MLAFAAAGCGGGDTPGFRMSAPALERTTLSVSEGTTTLSLTAGAATVLDAIGFTVKATKDASADRRAVRFPVTGGELSLSPPGGQLELAGGLRLSARGRSLDATSLVLDTYSSVLAGEVRGRRIPLLRLELERPPRAPPAGQRLTIAGDASLIGRTVMSEIGVEVLSEGLPLGRIEISVRG
jgi:hypothetical protein